MSRRTKLLIAALFLVLLAIPTAYVAITWTPSRPLLFRLVHIYPEEHRNNKGFRMLRISIENPNPIPIHLFNTHLDVSNRAAMDWWPPGYINPWEQRDGGIATSLDEFLLAPGSTTEVTAFLHPDCVEEARRNGMHAIYYRMTHTQERAATVYGWFLEHCSPSVRESLPPLRAPSDPAEVEVAIE